ncbi:hypothetical protein BS78_04G147400 [Paspalum vaginatum]|nr:hypothetical protein BS78_04G147400 [Paspalum vaginatum]
MERRRPEPAAIDITWVSCRGVKSSLPFHTPCLYASIFVTPSSAKNVHGNRRPHRVKTPTDRAGGENPEWDAPLRLYLPEATPPPPPAELEAGKTKNKKDSGEDVLLVRFELKAEVAVLGDVLAASAAVPVPDLVADGRTRRVSYQLVGPDGRQRNGVISFSYTFHERNDHHQHSSSSSDDGELVVVVPPFPTVSSPDAHPSPTAVAPRLYPAVEWLLTEQIPIYPPVPEGSAGVTLANSRYYPPPPSPATALEPVAAVYPPLPEMSSCSMYPKVNREVEVAPASGMYPTVDLAPVSCYPPPAPPLYGVECGYATVPGWDDRCLHG